MVRNTSAVIQKNCDYINLRSNMPVYVFLFYYLVTALSTSPQELSKRSSITNLTSLIVGDLSSSFFGDLFFISKDYDFVITLVRGCSSLNDPQESSTPPLLRRRLFLITSTQ